jgi:hypothetical protein
MQEESALHDSQVELAVSVGVAASAIRARVLSKANAIAAPAGGVSFASMLARARPWRLLVAAAGFTFLAIGNVFWGHSWFLTVLAAAAAVAGLVDWFRLRRRL